MSIQSRQNRGDHRGGALKVLMINTVPMAYEGITTVMLNYAGHMDRTGLQLDFAAINDPEPGIRAAIDAMGSKLHVLPGRNRRPLRYLWRLARLVRSNGYDIIHANGNSCTLAVEMLAARLGGARVRCAHSHNTQTGNPRAHRLLRGAFERNCTHALACGEAAGRWLFRDRPFEVLNNGNDLAQFAFDPEIRRQFRERLGLGGRAAIGHVGTFCERKNQAFLVDAFERALRGGLDGMLVLVGDGPTRPEIESTVARRGLSDRVIFTGVSREIPQILCAMDLMALPSLFEGLPNVVIEWQAAGLRALVADTVTEACRMTDLVRFLPLDADTWAQAMQGTKGTDADARARASAGAIRDLAAAGYDIRQNAERLRRLYFGFAGRPLPGRAEGDGAP